MPDYARRGTKQVLIAPSPTDGERGALFASTLRTFPGALPCSMRVEIPLVATNERKGEKGGEN